MTKLILIKYTKSDSKNDFGDFMLHFPNKFCHFTLPVVVIAGTFCFFSCATTRIISNSNGYDYTANRDDSLKKRPSWVSSENGMYEELLPDGLYHYVIGSYRGTSMDPPDDVEYARKKADSDARRQISTFLQSEVKTNSAEIVRERNMYTDVSKNGQTNSMSKGEAFDSTYVETYINSSASFSVFRDAGQYHE